MERYTYFLGFNKFNISFTTSPPICRLTFTTFHLCEILSNPKTAQKRARTMCKAWRLPRDGRALNPANGGPPLPLRLLDHHHSACACACACARAFNRARPVSMPYPAKRQPLCLQSDYSAHTACEMPAYGVFLGELR